MTRHPFFTMQGIMAPKTVDRNGIREQCSCPFNGHTIQNVGRLNNLLPSSVFQGLFWQDI